MELAISDLAVAKTRHEGLVRFEPLCFLAQQAAEKALKAVCRHHGIRFVSTHDIDELMSLLEDHGHPVPDAHAEATILTRYAVQTRYPSLQPNLTTEDLEEALQLAEALCAWASRSVGFPLSGTK